MEIIRLSDSDLDVHKKKIRQFLEVTTKISLSEKEINESYYDEKILKLETFVKDGSAIVFLALDGTELVGWIWCHSIMRFDEKFLHISELAIDEMHRRRGIGSLLMEAAEKYAKENDYAGLDLFVACKNVEAVELYNKKGFCTDKYLMNKRLEK